MNTQVLQIAAQLKEAFEGEPWFGKCAQMLLAETTPAEALVQLQGQHSITELVWHMTNWKRFGINRLRRDAEPTLKQFEADDWRTLDHSDVHLWAQGVRQFRHAHHELMEVLQQQSDELLTQKVAERDYNYHQLLHGLLHHDIYHLGQIAYIQKLLRAGAAG